MQRVLILLTGLLVLAAITVAQAKPGPGSWAEPYQQTYLDRYDRCWDSFAGRCGANLLDYVWKGGKPTPPAQVRASSARIERWLNPPEPAVVYDEAASYDPATTGGGMGCSGMEAESGSLGYANNTNPGYVGCYQISVDHYEPGGLCASGSTDPRTPAPRRSARSRVPARGRTRPGRTPAESSNIAGVLSERGLRMRKAAMIAVATGMMLVPAMAQAVSVTPAKQAMLDRYGLEVTAQFTAEPLVSEQSGGRHCEKGKVRVAIKYRRGDPEVFGLTSIWGCANNGRLYSPHASYGSGSPGRAWKRVLPLGYPFQKQGWRDRPEKYGSHARFGFEFANNDSWWYLDLDLKQVVVGDHKIRFVRKASVS